MRRNTLGSKDFNKFKDLNTSHQSKQENIMRKTARIGQTTEMSPISNRTKSNYKARFFESQENFTATMPNNLIPSLGGNRLFKNKSTVETMSEK